jgi:hypothetical protein
VQLFHDGNIQLLLCNQDFDISAPERRRQPGVEQGLRQVAAPQGKAFYSALAGPVAALNTGRDAHFGAGPGHGTKNKALPSRLLET